MIALSSLQQGIYEALDAALSQEVYAFVAPQNAAFPYVVIDSIEHYDGDTDSTYGQESVFSLRAFDKDISSASGINAMMSAIDTALHNQSITAAGYSNTFCFREFATSFVQTGSAAGEDHYYQANMRYRVRLVKN